MTADPTSQGWKVFAVTGGFEELVGPLYWRRDDGGAVRYGFRAAARHANPRGVVHGGMLMSFADYVLGSTVWVAVEKRPCATASLNCDFLAAAQVGDWIEGEAAVTRRGASLVFVQATLRTEEREVLTANGVWKILGAGGSAGGIAAG